MDDFFVSHITTSENCAKILKDHTFIHSKHDTQSKKYQWLGDGIYFWDGSDQNALKKGVRLVKHKESNSKKPVSSISFIISVDSDNYLDLANPVKEKKFVEFLKNTKAIDDYEEFIDSIQSVRTSKIVFPWQLNTIGRTFGTAINLYLKVLSDEGYSIDMIFYSFLSNKKETLLEGILELRNKQYCIKNNKVIPECEKWTIKNEL